MIQFPTHVRLLFICNVYSYSGVIDQADGERVTLRDAELVLDAGPMYARHWNEAEFLGAWTIHIKNIESWGIVEKTIKPDETRQDELHGQEPPHQKRVA